MYQSTPLTQKPHNARDPKFAIGQHVTVHLSSESAEGYTDEVQALSRLRTVMRVADRGFSGTSLQWHYALRSLESQSSGELPTVWEKDLKAA